MRTPNASLYRPRQRGQSAKPFGDGSVIGAPAVATKIPASQRFKANPCIQAIAAKPSFWLNEIKLLAGSTLRMCLITVKVGSEGWAMREACRRR